MSTRYIEQLAGGYHYHTLGDRRKVFTDIVIDEMSVVDQPKALDVGCGKGISAGVKAEEYLRRVREHAHELWGLDPALTEPPAHGMLDQFRHGLAEEADLPENYFDVAYSFMVVEHVTDPPKFFSAIHRALKPGGALVLCTVNAKHYFTRVADLCHKLKIDEVALRMVQGKKVDHYHFPVAYKCNSPEALRDAATKSGFESVQVAYSEEHPPAGYFKGPLKVFIWVGERNRRRSSDPTMLCNLYAVLRKPK